MSTAGGHTGDGDADADALAETLRDASFAHLVSHADGDAVAAAGTLARALTERGTPYQVSVARTPAGATRRLEDADGTSVALGFSAPTADRSVPETPSAAAFAATRALNGPTDPTLALAGGLAAGRLPGTDDVPVDADRRPGVALATADLADGLAHSTLVRADWSGDADAARAALATLDLPAELDADAHTRLASAVAIDACADAPASAATAIERALRPHVAGPFETLGGYADVLDCLARAAPGTATALALGHDVHDAARERWRDHSNAVHAALDAADGARYSGVALYRGAPVWTLARLARDFASPEPAALAVGSDALALATAEHDARAVLSEVAPSGAAGRETLAYARTETPDELAERVVDAL